MKNLAACLLMASWSLRWGAVAEDLSSAVTSIDVYDRRLGIGAALAVCTGLEGVSEITLNPAMMVEDVVFVAEATRTDPENERVELMLDGEDASGTTVSYTRVESVVPFAYSGDDGFTYFGYNDVPPPFVGNFDFRSRVVHPDVVRASDDWDKQVLVTMSVSESTAAPDIQCCPGGPGCPVTDPGDPGGDDPSEGEPQVTGFSVWSTGTNPTMWCETLQEGDIIDVGTTDPSQLTIVADTNTQTGFKNVVLGLERQSASQSDPDCASMTYERKEAVYKYVLYGDNNAQNDFFEPKSDDAMTVCDANSYRLTATGFVGSDQNAYSVNLASNFWVRRSGCGSVRCGPTLDSCPTPAPTPAPVAQTTPAPVAQTTPTPAPTDVTNSEVVGYNVKYTGNGALICTMSELSGKVIDLGAEPATAVTIEAITRSQQGVAKVDFELEGVCGQQNYARADPSRPYFLYGAQGEPSIDEPDPVHALRECDTASYTVRMTGKETDGRTAPTLETSVNVRRSGCGTVECITTTELEAKECDNNVEDGPCATCEGSNICDMSGFSWQEVTYNSPDSEVAKVARHENGVVAAGGQIYLIGGRGVRQWMRFDPTTREWTDLGIQTSKFHHFQPFVYEYRGKEYIYAATSMNGGFPYEWPSDDFVIYDFQENVLVEKGCVGCPQFPNLTRKRGAAGEAVWNDYVYVVGGITNGHWNGTVAWLDRCNLLSDADCEVLPDAPNARDHFQAAIVGNKLYAAGGRETKHEEGYEAIWSYTIGQVDVYDLIQNQWSTLPENLPTQRGGASTLNFYGRLLVIGGEIFNAAIAKTEMYDPATNRWYEWADLRTQRHGTGAVEVNGELYTVAGNSEYGGYPELPTMEKFTAASAPFCGPPPPEPEGELGVAEFFLVKNQNKELLNYEKGHHHMMWKDGAVVDDEIYFHDDEEYNFAIEVKSSAVKKLRLQGFYYRYYGGARGYFRRGQVVNIDRAGKVSVTDPTKFYVWLDGNQEKWPDRDQSGIAEDRWNAHQNGEIILLEAGLYDCTITPIGSDEFGNDVDGDPIQVRFKLYANSQTSPIYDAVTGGVELEVSEFKSYVDWQNLLYQNSLNGQDSVDRIYGIDDRGFWGDGRWSHVTWFKDYMYACHEKQGVVVAFPHDEELSTLTSGMWIFLDVYQGMAQAGRKFATANGNWHSGLRAVAFHPLGDNANGLVYVSAMEETVGVEDLSAYHLESNAIYPQIIPDESVLVEFQYRNWRWKDNSYRLLFRVPCPIYDHTIRQISFARYDDPDTAEDERLILFACHGDGSVESQIVGDGQLDDGLGKILAVEPTDGAYQTPNGDNIWDNILRDATWADRPNWGRYSTAWNPFHDRDNHNPGVVDIVGGSPTFGKVPREVWALGFRNPHTMTWSKEGKFFIGEAARDHLEEINLVVKGGNYGWPWREGNMRHIRVTNDAAGSGMFYTAVPMTQDQVCQACNFIGPVTEFGHPGYEGMFFNMVALAMGYFVDNDSPVHRAGPRDCTQNDVSCDKLFYTDFPHSSEVLYSYKDDMLNAQTLGDANLVVAPSYRVTFNFKGQSGIKTFREVLAMSSASRAQALQRGIGDDFVGNFNRANTRFGQDPNGGLYMACKEDGYIYRFDNTVPNGATA